MTIYIDSDFKCHVTDDGDMTKVETDFLDGKCDAYLEGYRFVPAGKVWVRPDGTVFRGELISPWKDWKKLDRAQRIYERERLESLEAENAALLDGMADLVEDVYQSDLEMMGL